MQNNSKQNTANIEPKKRPLSIKETLSILLAGHIGVRKSSQRKEDFDRASGSRIFLAAAVYFGIIVVCLVFLVRYVVS